MLSSKLSLVRSHFSKFNIAVYVVLTQDEHQSEYIADADKRRAYISGFTGSAGTAVISKDKAALATDGRYFLQAAKELNSDWELLKEGVKGVPTWQEWAITQATKAKSNIGVDPKLISYSDVVNLNELIQKKGLAEDISVVSLETNLIDLVWGEKRPSRSKDAIFQLPVDFAGETIDKKLKSISAEVKSKNGTAFVVSALDEIAWLFNLRGNDILYNPVFFSYAIISADGKAYLYIDQDKIDEKVAQYLSANKVQVKDYNMLFDDAAKFRQELVTINANVSSKADHKKLLVPNSGSWALVNALGGTETIDLILSPIMVAKAVKNSTEIKNARKAQILDGVALVRYLSWLEESLKKGESYSDYAAGQKSLEFRQQNREFKGLSFETISSSGPMAAVIHYSPAPDSKQMVKKEQVYLLDSGGQYFEGTTDTTRTFHFGKPTAEEKTAFTLVLKGHIALATAVFPEGTTGNLIESQARRYLWQYGLDYRHGTGHGIGSYLNVHESPIGISQRSTAQSTLRAGNLISNEPGYYEDGKYGIRIENIILCKEMNTPFKFGGIKYLGFETITQVPLGHNLMDMDLLSVDEKKWINEYHAQVYDAVRPYFKEGESALEWLRRETLPIF